MIAAPGAATAGSGDRGSSFSRKKLADERDSLPAIAAVAASYPRAITPQG